MMFPQLSVVPGRVSRKFRHAVLPATVCSLAALFGVAGVIASMGCAGVRAADLGSTANPIQVSITPANAVVNSGASLQLRASVTGTSETGVSWLASGGSISTAGLLAAPNVTSATSVAVTAVSAADNARQATVMVSVAAAGGPQIDTTSIAPAIVGDPYSANLTASGGEAPYRWRIVSGTLPAGLQLNSASGAVEGTPVVAGDSSLIAGLTDVRGETAQQNLNLLVSAPACGPPNYACSRTDFAAIIPTAPPQLGSDSTYYGGHSGAGMVAIDPAYGNRILRVTDGDTDPSTPGMSFGTSWSAEANLISSDESMFFVTNEGSVPCLFQFNLAAFKATFRGCQYNSGGGNLQFGYTPADANAFYSYSGPYLKRFVIDRSTWEISHDKQFNHGVGHFDPDGPECLNGQLAAEKQWYVQDTSLSSDDSTFISAMGPEQDVSHYIVVWNASKGCRWMNIRTWEVSQGWNTGTANPVKISWVSGNAPTGTGGVHNVGLDRSGVYGVLVINGTSLNWKLFWDLDSERVNDTCTQCQSHWACDFGVCFWSFGPGFEMRDLPIFPSTDMSSMMGHKDLPVIQSTMPSGTDMHAAHQNASIGQKNLYLLEVARDTDGFKIEGAWDGELLGVSWDGSKRTVRFNKVWSSGFFAGCSMSRLGHYAICGSDYQTYNRDKGFGNGLNQDTCDHTSVAWGRGTDGCRGDVLLFELR